MRAVLQRVIEASVRVDGEIIGQIGAGLLVLLGVETGDTDADLDTLVGKVAGLRIFADADGKMNRSVAECGGALLVVSQFTLLGDARKGRRPSFVQAMEPTQASLMCDRAVAAWRALDLPVQTGRFGADMQVALINDGPVTILLDSRGRI